MKRISIALMALVLSSAAIAQTDNEKFTRAMEKNIALLDSAKPRRTGSMLQQLLKELLKRKRRSGCLIIIQH